MSVHTRRRGHIQGTWRNENLGHGDAWDVVGEASLSVKGTTEVSGWGTREGGNAHPEREKLEGLCQARSWSSLSASAFPRPSTATGTQALSKYLPYGWRAKSTVFEITVHGLLLILSQPAV